MRKLKWEKTSQATNLTIVLEDRRSFSASGIGKKNGTVCSRTVIFTHKTWVWDAKFFNFLYASCIKCTLSLRCPCSLKFFLQALKYHLVGIPVEINTINKTNSSRTLVLKNHNHLYFHDSKCWIYNLAKKIDSMQQHVLICESMLHHQDCQQCINFFPSLSISILT